MQPELRAAAFIWDALNFGRNVHVLKALLAEVAPPDGTAETD